MDICVPVAGPVKASGQMEPGEWPAMSLVRSVYRGGYEGLYEVHVSGPDASPDPATWRPELNQPVAS